MMAEKPASGQTQLLDSKSRIADLQRQIDELMRQFYASGDHELMAQAAKLSQQKENLLKPRAFRAETYKRAS